MSKTVRNHPESNPKAGREDPPQKTPEPYPPVDPVVAQRQADRKDR